MTRIIEDKEYVICPTSSSSMPYETNTSSSNKYQSYSWRWYMLAVTCLLALSNAAIWISFSSVGSHVSVFYCDDSYFDEVKNGTKFLSNGSFMDAENNACNVAYWNGQIFQIVGCIGGIFGIFITDKYGIVVSTYCASILNFVGIILRTISAIPSMSHSWRLFLLYSGQTFAASSQPFFLVLSPKVAEFWFADNQRALANALSFAANPAGVVLGTVAPELIVREVTERNSFDLLWLNILLLCFGTIVMFLTFGVTSNKPPTPPSASSATDHYPPFLEGLIALFKIPMFYIQILSFGMAFGLQWSLFISIEPMLSHLGYHFIGYAAALSAIAGCASSIVAGCYVDKSKKFTEVIKGSAIGIAFVACFINAFLRHKADSESDPYIMALLLMMLGFFSIPAFPIGLELAIETTFPIAEASSSGILIIVSQLLLFLMSAIMNWSPKWDLFYSSKVSPGHNHDESLFDKNFQLSVDIWTGISVAFMLFTCFALWPKYKRLEYERAAAMTTTTTTTEPKDSLDEI